MSLIEEAAPLYNQTPSAQKHWNKSLPWPQDESKTHEATRELEEQISVWKNVGISNLDVV